MTAPHTQAVTGFVSHDLRMWYEFVTCPMAHAVLSTPRAFATAGGTLPHCANLSVVAFTVRSNVWASWFCSQRPCWLVLSRSPAGQASAALLAEGAITATITSTLRFQYAGDPQATMSGGTWPRHRIVATSLSQLAAWIITTMTCKWPWAQLRLPNSRRCLAHMSHIARDYVDS